MASVPVSLPTIVRTIVDADFLELDISGKPCGRVGEVDTRVQVLDFRLDSGKRTGGRNAVDDKLVPDFIFLKSGSSVKIITCVLCVLCI